MCCAWSDTGSLGVGPRRGSPGRAALGRASAASLRRQAFGSKPSVEISRPATAAAAASSPAESSDSLFSYFCASKKLRLGHFDKGL